MSEIINFFPRAIVLRPESESIKALVVWDSIVLDDVAGQKRNHRNNEEEKIRDVLPVKLSPY